MSKQKRHLGNQPRVSSYSYYKSPSANTGNSSRTERSGVVLRSIRLIRSKVSFLRLIIALALLIIIIFLLSAENDPIIRFSTSEVNARDTSVYRSEIKQIISRSVFNRSKLLFDYRSVEDDIKLRFPEIESLNISFDIVGRKPVVRIQIQEPAYLYQASNLTWVIDTRGIALGQKSDLKESYIASLYTIIDEGTTEGETGKALISSQQVEYLNVVVDLLEKKQITVENIYIPLNPKQIDLTIKAENWRYKLSTEEQATNQAGTLIAARETLLVNGNTPTEYVDIRSGEKVYWK